MSDKEANVFERIESESVTPMSRRERWSETFDAWVVTPFEIIWEDSRTKLGSIILLGYVLMGTVGVWITEPPELNEGPAYLGMFNSDYVVQPFGIPEFTILGWTYTGIWKFPLGTNNWGVGIMEQAVHATPDMLLMALAGGGFMTIVAVLTGTLAGYKRGAIGRVILTAIDIQITIPGLPLLIVVAVALSPSNPILVGILLSIDGWPNLARSLYSQVISTREESYVEASRTIGLGSGSIIRDDILPSVMPYVMINFMRNTVRVIHASVALYFLGALPLTRNNWGIMLDKSFDYVSLLTLNNMNWVLTPIILIGGLGFATILLSQGLDRLFNPRVRARHSDEGDGITSYD
ncbi:ABC transporter permease [Halosimplex marinum]|uniref:ABC transporter permease n=1 Tax=Halosimplex marinum TaxID=3396620 RepID=UPI003F569D0A